MDTIYHENISCKSKKQYLTIDHANDMGKIQMFNNSNNPQLYIYKCSYCDKYHLTQKETDLKVF